MSAVAAQTAPSAQRSVNLTEKMLELRQVSAGYGSFQALFDVDLEVHAGEAVAVIGPNGAGKTTLLRVISRLIGNTRGELLMDGRRYDALPAWDVIGLGIAQVPEGRRLFPQLSVEDNLRIGAYLPAARSQLASRLEFVYSLFPRMQERRSQLAGTLSGGEQQMCAIGRALMSGPRLLLLDEPSAGLAPVIVQSIFSLIQKIRAQGYTVLIVEQNVKQVLGVVDRAYLMETGKMRASGSAAEMLANDDVRKAYLGL
jgi:branched-chain amino acid transport system ATP-binding protein